MKDNAWLSSRFSQIQYINEGGMGQVFTAYDKKKPHKGRIALKVLKPAWRTFSVAKKNLLHEGTCERRCHHPHIIKTYDITSIAQQPVKCMHYIDGETLAQNPQQSASIEQRMTWLLQLANALTYLHKKKLIHADITPKNLMITKDAQLYLFDFGRCQIKAWPKRCWAFNPLDHSLADTVYSAPEQHTATQAKTIDDIYSWAAIARYLFQKEYNKLPKNWVLFLEKAASKQPETRPSLSQWKALHSD